MIPGSSVPGREDVTVSGGRSITKMKEMEVEDKRVKGVMPRKGAHGDSRIGRRGAS